jgi:DNA mismatch repair protein MutS
MEYEIFCQLREDVSTRVSDIKTTATAIATLDCLVSLSEIALMYDYNKPEFHENGFLKIKDGRHPVVERFYLKEGFVPNDCNINPEEENLIIITGPNMSGKSTYLRQVALISLMAQIGSFVPARSAQLPIIDRIFTRIGAFDELSEGRSTFLVEMNETARILSNSTTDSLILLDEVGRGTSTFDGVSLAWAICEYIHDRISAKTLFATHYHELALLPKILDRAKNYTVLVRESKGNIIFLRKVMAGVTDKSYGVQVAKLAGLPDEVLERAKEVLSILEGASLGFGTPLSQLLPDGAQLSFSSVNSDEQDDEDHPVVKRLKGVEINRITPVEALNLLSELIKEIEDDDK